MPLQDPGADGTFTYALYQTRDSNQVSSAPTSLTWILDTTAPAGPSTAPISDFSNQTTQTLTGTKEPNTSIWISVDGAAPYEAVPANSATAWSYDLTLAPGAHNIEVTARDGVGNTSVSTVLTSTVDTTNPTAPLLDPLPADPVSATSYTLTGAKEADTAIWICCDPDPAKPANTFMVAVPRDANTTWSYLVQLTTEGANAITVKAVDRAGNESPTAEGVILRDTTAPNAPVVTSPVLSPTQLFSQTLSGNKDADSSLRINGVEVVALNASSTWSAPITIPALSMDGLYDFNLTSMDLAGNESTLKKVSVILDTTPPALPVISSPFDQPLLTVLVNSTSVVISGSKEANSRVLVNNVPLAMTAAEIAAVSWSVNQSLVEGFNALNFSTRDQAGNNSVGFVTVSINRDTSIPASPGVDPFITPVRDATRTQTIQGTKDANTSIWRVYDNAGIPARIVAEDTLTTWSAVFTIPAGAAEGAHTFNISAKNQAGTNSLSTIITIMLDTMAPPVPVLNAVTTPTSAGAQVLSGTAEANAIILSSHNGGALTTLATADGAGMWSGTMTLSEGLNTLDISAKDAAGNISATAVTTSITRDSTPPTVPVINPVTTPTNVTTQGITGTKEANSSIWSNGVEVVALDALTTWSYSAGLATGTNTFNFTSKDGLGNTSAVATAVILLDQSAPLAPTLSPAPPALVNTLTVTLGGGKDANTAIWINGTQALALSSGTTWSTSVNLTVEGNNTFNIMAVDSAGNMSPVTSATIVRDRTAPGIPGVNAVTSPTKVSTQTLTGTKDANSSILINGVQVVALNGLTTWSAPVSFGPVDAPYSFAVTSRDLAGNESGATNVSIILDTQAPQAPVLSPSPALLVNTTSMTLAGTKDANTAIWINGAQAVVLSAGTAWSTSVGLGVEGNNTFNITAVDAAGNVSPATSVTIVRDTLAPAVPSVNPVSSPTKTATQTLTGAKDANSSIWINGVEAVVLDGST
ncbi:MAG: Ig-like domain-containing protein, partial [Deltaproteobacteria bacterium]|nr:Ig-like domain-containing protein [Deltaproteobacteria bacterium]